MTSKEKREMTLPLPPKVLMETIDNLNMDITELRAMNAQLRDALHSLQAKPTDKTCQHYAKYVLLKSEKEIGRKYYND